MRTTKPAHLHHTQTATGREFHGGLYSKDELTRLMVARLAVTGASHFYGGPAEHPSGKRFAAVVVSAGRPSARDFFHQSGSAGASPYQPGDLPRFSIAGFPNRRKNETRPSVTFAKLCRRSRCPGSI